MPPYEHEEELAAAGLKVSYQTPSYLSRYNEKFFGTPPTARSQRPRTAIGS